MAPAKILVVDDEPMVESLINQRFKNKIKANEFLFSYCRNGEDALQFLNKNPDIELVLIDINMPVMDGFTLLDSLMKQKRNYRVIIVTAYADMTNVRRAISKGAADFITKPIDLDDLEQTLIRNLKYLSSAKDSERREKELLGFLKELKGTKTIYPSCDFKKLSKEGKDIYAEIFPETTIECAFFDLYPWDERSIGFAIGDVQEGGLGAALLMTACRSFLNALCIHPKEPSFCLKALKAMILIKEMTLSLRLFFGVFDAESGSIRYSNLGNMCPFIVSKEGGCKAVNEAHEEVKLVSGDAFIMVTKKILDLNNRAGEPYQTRLKDLLKKNAGQPPEAIVKGIKSDINLFLGNLSEVPSLALLILRYQGSL